MPSANACLPRRGPRWRSAPTCRMRWHQGVRLARGLMLDGDVRSVVAAGPPLARCASRARTPRWWSVGSHGRGGMPGLVIGYVSIGAAAGADGRVVVVRGTWRPVPDHVPLPVVVGTDGSPESAPAVAFAFEEAALRQTFLVAVCGLSDEPGVLGVAGRTQEDFEKLIDQQQRDHPGVNVRRHVSEGSARGALREAGGATEFSCLGAADLISSAAGRRAPPLH